MQLVFVRLKLVNWMRPVKSRNLCTFCFFFSDRRVEPVRSSSDIGSQRLSVFMLLVSGMVNHEDTISNASSVRSGALHLGPWFCIFISSTRVVEVVVRNGLRCCADFPVLLPLCWRQLPPLHDWRPTLVRAHAEVLQWSARAHDLSP